MASSGSSPRVHPVLQSLSLDFLFTAEVLVLEMTYLDGPVDKAVSRGHVHLAEFLAEGHMFNNRCAATR